MLLVILHHPSGNMDPTDEARLTRTIKQATAAHMEAIDPESGVSTNFSSDPDRFVRVILRPYDPRTPSETMPYPYMGLIMAAGWPDRMQDLNRRLEIITGTVNRTGINRDMRARLGEPAEGEEELVCFTFTTRDPRTWMAA